MEARVLPWRERHGRETLPLCPFSHHYLTLHLSTQRPPRQLKTQQELVQEQSRRVTITEDTLCRVPTCRRPIGA